jgi:hypothetical protein
LKLILEHYYDPLTFQPDMLSGGRGRGCADVWGAKLVTTVMIAIITVCGVSPDAEPKWQERLLNRHA